MNENELKSYLLGLLPEPAQAQLELRLLSEHKIYEQLLVAEDDLLEAYLQGELSADERARFERVFLAHPTRRQHLSLIQTLQSRAGNQAESRMAGARTTSTANAWNQVLDLLRNPLWQLAAVGVVLGIAFCFLYVRMGRQAARENVSTVATTSPRTLPTPSPAMGTAILSAEISPGQVMAIGSEKKILHLTPKIGQVKLALWLQKDRYETYRAALQSYDPVFLKELPGEFKRQGTKDLKFIEVLIPVTDLQGQDFTLKLDGITANGERQNADTFQFKVKRD